MAQTKEPRKTNTLFRKTYKDVVEKQVDENEYSLQMQEFAKNFSRLYLKNAGMKKSDVDVILDKDNLKILNGEKEIINIKLNENIISGKNHNLSKVGRAKDIIEIAEDIGVELEVTGMMLQNTKDEELNNRGFYISSKETAPTIMQSIEYSLSKLPTDDKDMVNYDIDDLNAPSEYSINLARRRTFLNNFKSIVDMETKAEILDEKVKNSMIDDVLEKMEIENEKSYYEESSILNVFAENSELNYSRPEMLILMHPEIIEKDNSLKNKFNEDGTLIEFDKLIELREKNKEDKRNNGNYKEETLERVTKEIDESFAELMYQKLLNNHSKFEIKDLRKRLGDDEFLKELDTILDVKARVRDDNYNLSVDFVDYALENREKILNNLNLDTKTRFNAVLENTKGDIEYRDNEYAKIEERLAFIKDIRQHVINTKGMEKKYTPQELEKSDNERDLRRINIVGLIGGAFAAIKTGASKTFEEWKKKRDERQKEYDEPVEIDVDIPEPSIKVSKEKEEKKVDKSTSKNIDKNNNDEKKDKTVEKEVSKEYEEEEHKEEPEDKTKIVNGPPGKDGKDGRDGVDGKDGEPGKDGKDGEPGGNTYIYNTYYTDQNKVEQNKREEPKNSEELTEKENEENNSTLEQEDLKQQDDKVIQDEEKDSKKTLENKTIPEDDEELDIQNPNEKEEEILDSEEISFTINGMSADEYEKEQYAQENRKEIEDNLKEETDDENIQAIDEENNGDKTKEEIKESMTQELINSKNILLEGLREQNQIEIDEYRKDLEKRVNDIIDSLDTNKYSIEELLRARDHLNEKIERDVLKKTQKKQESLDMIEASMNKYIERKSLEEKLFELEEKRAEFKKKELLISSIEKDAVKSLEDVEKEIEEVKSQMDDKQKEENNGYRNQE